MARSRFVLAVAVVILCCGSSRADVRAREGGRGGAVAAREISRQGGGIAVRAVQVPAAMTAGRQAQFKAPTNAMRVFGGAGRPAARAGVSRASADTGDATVPPARYGFYAPASQPSQNAWKAETYKTAPAAPPANERPMAMIEDEYRAILNPAPAQAQESFGAGHDRVILNGPIGEAGQANGVSEGSLMSLFMGGN